MRDWWACVIRIVSRFFSFSKLWPFHHFSRAQSWFPDLLWLVYVTEVIDSLRTHHIFLAFLNSLFVNGISVFTSERWAEMMERNASWHRQQLDMRIDTPEERRVWVHEINHAGKQTRLIPPSSWFWLVVDRDVTSTAWQCSKKLNYFNLKVIWQQQE